MAGVNFLFLASVDSEKISMGMKRWAESWLFAHGL